MNIMNVLDAIKSIKNKSHLSTIDKTETSLPVNIFISQKRRNKKDVLYFQTNKEVTPNLNNPAIITLNSNKVLDKALLLKQGKVDIQTINAIENFCINNSFALPLYASSLLSSKEFLDTLIKGSELQSNKTIIENEQSIKALLKSNLINNVYDKEESTIVENLLA